MVRKIKCQWCGQKTNPMYQASRYNHHWKKGTTFYLCKVCAEGNEDWNPNVAFSTCRLTQGRIDLLEGEG